MIELASVGLSLGAILIIGGVILAFLVWACYAFAGYIIHQIRESKRAEDEYAKMLQEMMDEEIDERLDNL